MEDILKEFSNLINSDDYKKEINIKGHKFVIKIMPFKIISEVLNKDAVEGLASSIESINGKQYPEAEKRKLLENLPAPIVNYIADEITKLYNEYREEIESIKKK